MTEITEHDEEGRIAPPNVEYTIWADCRITRRKYYHIVANKAGEVLFKAKLLGDCFEWLEDRDVALYRLCTEEYTLILARRFGQKRERS